MLTIQIAYIITDCLGKYKKFCLACKIYLPSVYFNPRFDMSIALSS